MKIKLGIADRLNLIGLLPTEKTTFEDLIICEAITDKLQITIKEIAEFEIKTVGNSTQWNEKGVKSELDIKLEEIEANLIKTLLKKKNEDKEMSKHYFKLYKLFV